MSRFIHGGSKLISADQIRIADRDTEASLTIVLLDDSTLRSTGLRQNSVERAIAGKTHIVQVIPVVKPIFAIFHNLDNKEKFDAVPIYYWALCADGIVRPLWLCDYQLEPIADISMGFYGICDADGLDEFPGAREFLSTTGCVSSDTVTG